MVHAEVHVLRYLNPNDFCDNPGTDDSKLQKIEKYEESLIPLSSRSRFFTFSFEILISSLPSVWATPININACQEIGLTLMFTGPLSKLTVNQCKRVTV
jgi:hypothetical protein